MRAAPPAALALLALVACRPPPDEEPLACRNEEAGQAELGVGDLNTGFLPLEDGDPLFVSFGPQGMHMVVVSLRVTAMERSSGGGQASRVEIALWQDGEIVGGTSNAMLPSAESGEVVDYLGLRAIFTVAEIEGVGNRAATVEGTAVDGCGRELSASMDVFLTL